LKVRSKKKKYGAVSFLFSILCDATCITRNENIFNC
jgi:hypothetical protein